MRRRWAFACALLVGLGGSAAKAESASLQGTPFDAAPNAAALPQLASGRVVRRSTAEGNLTADDRFRLRALGLTKTHSAAVVLHRIPKAAGGEKQAARLKAIARSLDAFAPSGACDAIVAEGEARAMCTGHVDGPLGKVPVRMPVAAKVSEGDGGSLRLVIQNHQPMEAKPLFAWSEVVAPGRLKVAYDMFPTDDAWLVYVRIGVEMSAHEGSAKTISDAMLKLESWLTRELAKS
ncbi:MAG: hypothetical protein KF819_25775 [Labilithrix sp.]|nr:hypothetical protein [Labilithrix sp.]